jgi:hypothetical protein
MVSRPDRSNFNDRALHNVCRFEPPAPSVTLWFIVNSQGACRVDMALRLNVMAVFAVMMFISAILLGAF